MASGNGSVSIFLFSGGSSSALIGVTGSFGTSAAGSPGNSPPVVSAGVGAAGAGRLNTGRGRACLASACGGPANVSVSSALIPGTSGSAVAGGTGLSGGAAGFRNTGRGRAGVGASVGAGAGLGGIFSAGIFAGASEVAAGLVATGSVGFRKTGRARPGFGVSGAGAATGGEGIFSISGTGVRGILSVGAPAGRRITARGRAGAGSGVRSTEGDGSSGMAEAVLGIVARRTTGLGAAVAGAAVGLGTSASQKRRLTSLITILTLV